MAEPGTITRWISELHAGKAAAAEELWAVYFQRMVEVARGRLPPAAKRMADEEDVALSAFRSFCRGVQNRRFPQLVGRDSLWPLLVALTAHKAKDLARYELRQKRGGVHAAPARNWEEFLSREPAPEIATLFADQLEHLLTRLEQAGDDDLRRIVFLSLEGHTSREMADQLGCVLRTVQRKLQMIRKLWEEEAP